LLWDLEWDILRVAKEREELKNHLKECPKHPLREVEIKIVLQDSM